MASPLTLDNLRELAADRADMLKYDAAGAADLSDFLDTAAMSGYVNLELAALWDHLVTTYEDYAIKHYELPLYANQEEYNLPADFYKIRKVFPVLPNGRSWPLKRFDMQELGSETTATVRLGTDVRQLRYRIMGNRLYFYPTPSGVATVEVWYVPQYLPVENRDDKIDFRFPIGTEDYVVEGVAARCLEKEESDATHCRQAQQVILQRITTSLQDRDIGDPAGMIDAEGYDWRQFD